MDLNGRFETAGLSEMQKAIILEMKRPHGEKRLGYETGHVLTSDVLLFLSLEQEREKSS